MSKGDCLKKALSQTGIEVDIPDWTLYEDTLMMLNKHQIL
jgi:hypothetical protein